MVANNTLQNLYIDVQGSGVGAKPGGDPLERILTVHNRGDRSANVELWLEPTDARSAPLLRWAEFDVSVTDLRLEPGQEKDVRLTFQVPPQAKPGFYSYEIRASSDQYLGEEVRRTQQLQILPSAQELELRNEPKVIVEPYTDSENPYILTAGSTLNITITIENPSRRTDRFSLFCPDLPLVWYNIEYPERQSELPGVVRQTEGLELNPQEQGEIRLAIHPPQYTPAKNYFPTLRIRSNNRSDLVLLEIVYLTIPVDDRMAVELHPDVRKIPSPEESFKLSLFNFGNIDRQFELFAQDIDRLFDYEITPEQIELAPGKETTALLVPRSRHWWRRIWRLQERSIVFEVGLKNVWHSPDHLVDALVENPDALSAEALPQPRWLPALPEALPRGTIVWKAQRRWLFKLLVAALVLGLLTAAIALIWYFFFWRPSLKPRILVFESAKENYQEGIDPTVELDWEITNPYDIDRVVIFQGQQDKQTIIEILENSPDSLQSYQFNQSSKGGIPPALQPQPLEVQPGSPITSTQNGSCSIVEVSEENGSLLRPLFRLHRRIFRKESPNEKILRCTDIAVANFLAGEDALEEGQYSFTLMVFQKTDEESDDDNANVGDSNGQLTTMTQEVGPISDTAFIKDIAVAAPAPPQILDFSATASEYRFIDAALIAPAAPIQDVPVAAVAPEEDAATEESTVEEGAIAEGGDAEDTVTEAEDSIRVDGTQTQLSPAASLPETDETPTVPIRLNWTISNLADIEAIKLVSVAPDGSENTRPITFDGFDPNQAVDAFTRIDPQLRPYCFNQSNQLVCQGVPTTATKVGEYTFYLTVVTNRDDVQEDIVSSTATIPIKPPMPRILNFLVNGESVEMKPKFVYAVNPARKSFDIQLNWQVEHATEVELLPAPGRIERQNAIYTISAAPGSEMLTLRAVNELGEEMTRSVVIEKVEYASPLVTQPGGSGSNSSGNGQLPPPPPTLPVPSLPPSSNQLPPLELPPQAD